MKFVARLAAILAILVLALGVGVYAYARSLPSTWHVVAEAKADAPRAKVIGALMTPAEWSHWMNVGAVGAEVTYETFGPTTGVGAGQTWSSPGTFGRMEISGLVEGGIEYKMTMEASETPAHGSIRYMEDASGAKLVWTDDGDMTGMPLAGLMATVMEKSLAPQLGHALEQLDGYAQGLPDPPVGAEPVPAAAP